ncbi:hypothetical protein BCR33DRAFT_335044 [Rhizoclosmatium globosum]|uniref:Uncharacterized protein n=1 Tax=Rhizoclosmatium globosum TaxID=329046 RepID=A0A1Y2C5F6_9FUNG|nr:hypothetical protein BCR33DRAFT_335044 [Rhizoclosmatium globosum]|eukprot:ORY41545.1 hypothetical protein BCR33DRAFT_335044 [Rhizoclosmatium globosum]
MSSGTVPIIIGGVAGFAALIGLIVVCYRHYSKSQKVLPLEQLPPTSSPALTSSEQALRNPVVSRSTPEQCPPATEPVQETFRDPITPPIVNDLIPSATSMPTTNASIDQTAELIQSEALEPLTNESSPTPTQPPPRPQSNLLINYDMRTMPAGTRYHTISHVWDKVSLLPDPCKQTGVLLTSPEKQAAVARIAEAAGVPVWMDVYSIDQENEEFKNAQVYTHVCTTKEREY